MDGMGGPDAKKARWSPNSSPRDAFANYGYGPQTSMAQPFPSPSNPGFGNALYSSPQLSINTQTNTVNPPQPSPNGWQYMMPMFNYNFNQVCLISLSWLI